MNKMTALVFWMGLYLVTMACDHNPRVKEQNPRDSEVDNTEPLVYKNIFVADETVSDKLGLARTRFAIEYPDDVEVVFPDNNRDYIIFKVRQNGMVTEELWLGETTQKIVDKKDTKFWIEQAVKTFQMSSPNIQVDFMGEAFFNGHPEYLLWGIIDFSDFETNEYLGNYNVLYTIPYPKLDYHLHAVRVTMLFNQSLNVSTLQDAQHKAKISKIWKTFRYLE